VDMKTRAWVSCLVSSYWVLACGAEAPPEEPREPSVPEDEVSVIATAEALSAAAAATATSGSGGTSSDSSASADTSGSSGSQATTAVATTSVTGTSATGGASAISGGSATDASTTDGSGASGAAGASAATGGAGSDSAGTGGAAGAEAVSTTSGASDGAGGGEPTSTTGDALLPPPVPVGSLLITEYVESGGDKAIEISNLGPQSLSLAECRLETYFNGNVESTSGVDLNVELEPEQSWVLCNSPEHAALLAICDQPSSVNFNGNDALVLRCNAAVHDSFGQVGDPGEAWQSSEAADGESYSSEDHVLRRRCGALPRTDPLPMFEVALTEDWVSIWEIKSVPTGPEFDGLGKSTCADRPVPSEGEGAGGASASSSDGSASE